jgi:hypothetical protein
MNQQVILTRQALRTPHAAAVAGIIFAVLFTTSIVLIRIALAEDSSGTNTAAWLQGNTTPVSLALTLAPFAGIAFLWFMGVVRDRFGTLEDQFFSTVFMISSGVIWMRTRVMPRLFVFLTFALALLLLVISSLTLWLVLIFPVWVFVISVFLLIASLRGEQAEGMVGSNES